MPRTHLDGHLGIITLNNPEKRNSLNSALIQELLSTLDEFEESEWSYYAPLQVPRFGPLATTSMNFHGQVATRSHTEVPSSVSCAACRIIPVRLLP